MMNPPSSPALSTLFNSMAERARLIEQAIDRLLPMTEGMEARLIEAMRYATLGGGKRFRGYLVTEVAQIFGADMQQALRAAASVEMLHAYSLVHDDLPCMDDDDLRRGQPSTHKKFDEATAILCGDALQTRAFEILAEKETHPDPGIRIRLVEALARASGPHGMVGGQMLDMQGEGKALSLEQVERLHALKTGCLIRYSAEAGAILGHAAAHEVEHIIAYGRLLGMAFQIADDVLDATANEEALGKTAGKDMEVGKSTFVSLLGTEGAARAAQDVAQKAAAQLDIFSSGAENLRLLTYYVTERRS